MSPLTPIQPKLIQPARSAQPKFGQANLGTVTQVVANGMSWLEETRGRELLVMDIFGFTGLRTMMDSLRERFFKKTKDGKRPLNLSAGLERVVMELMGSAPDLVGYLAVLMGFMANKGKRGSFNNRFTDFNTLSLFHDIAKQPATQSTEQFLHQLATKIAGNKTHAIEAIESHLKTLKTADLKSQPFSKVATNMAQALKQNHFSVAIPEKGIFNLETLAEETYHFLQAAGHQFPQASKILESAQKTTSWRIPVCMAIGLAWNFISPLLVHKLTRALYGHSDYPGELGLRDLQKDTAKKKHPLFPYLNESIKQGNFLPLLVSLVPLPIILGFLNTEKLVPNNIFKLGVRGFGKNFLSMMQFSKRAPFVGAGMMAILYAAVVGARVATSRTAVEMRERVFDGYAGWTTWIVAAPVIQKALFSLGDKYFKTSLLKTIQYQGKTITEIKSKQELSLLEEALYKKSAKVHTWVSFGSVVATMLLLGVVEPYISIRLSEIQERLLMKKNKQLVAPQSLPTGQGMGIYQAPISTFKSFIPQVPLFLAQAPWTSPWPSRVQPQSYNWQPQRSLYSAQTFFQAQPQPWYPAPAAKA